jgi:hypothetical protein
LELNEEGKDSLEDIKWSAAAIYSGGVHNTLATFSNFIVAMMLYPEVARKAREEIDRVVGNERLPAVSDRDNLPYLECILLETLRWHPVAPLGRLGSKQLLAGSLLSFQALPGLFIRIVFTEAIGFLPTVQYTATYMRYVKAWSSAH